MHNPGSATPDRFPAQDRFADGAQYIAGRLTKGTSGRTHAVVDPATGEEVHTYELAGPDDVEKRVAAVVDRKCGGLGPAPGPADTTRLAGVAARVVGEAAARKRQALRAHAHHESVGVQCAAVKQCYRFLRPGRQIHHQMLRPIGGLQVKNDRLRR